MLSGVAPVGRASLATNSTSNTFPDRATTVTWFADTARVRPSIAALNLLGYGARGRADVAGYGPASGVVQVVVGAQANELDGLILDTWRETRPLRETTSGLAFHHDAPRARAPQSILLAVPPDPTAGWSLSALEATVKETIDLMIARLARTHEVWGPLLPALFFAENLAGETVSTTLEDVAIDIVVRD